MEHFFRVHILNTMQAGLHAVLYLNFVYSHLSTPNESAMRQMRVCIVSKPFSKIKLIMSDQFQNYMFTVCQHGQFLVAFCTSQIEASTPPPPPPPY